MATKGRSRQGRSSLGLERLELVDGQGQGGGWEPDEINCMDNFSSFLDFDVFMY